MIVQVNGEETVLPDGASVVDAVAVAGVDPGRRGIAVALDGEVVPRAQLAEKMLSEGQRIEIVAAIQGGAR